MFILFCEIYLFFNVLNIYSSNEIETTCLFKEEVETKSEKKEEAGIRDLFQPSQMKYRTLNMFYQWCAVTLAYYGLTFSSTDLAGDPYANFCSGVGIEIPGKFFLVITRNSNILPFFEKF